MKKAIVQVDQLKKHFNLNRKQTLKAVDGVSFSVYRGETLGLVGESGCGKSTVGKLLIRLLRPTSGNIIFQQQHLDQRSEKQSDSFHRKIQMIFQDPYASLNPRMKVMDTIAEGMEIHGLASGKKKRERVMKLLELVGLKANAVERFPHEFSGGQRQRIGIARALAVEPDFIIADEPISALDVSIQAQVVNLMKRLQQERGLTYLFISHDLAMVKYMSDRIGVMYLGKLVELADRDDLYEKPLHPYTEALLSAIPIPDPQEQRTRERILLKGEVPSPIDPPSGCAFRERCPRAMEVCAELVPAWKEVRSKHGVACHLY